METILSKAAFAFAVILQPDIGGALQPLHRETMLGGRDGQAGDVMVVGGGAFGKAAPAAADLQHRGVFLLEFGNDALIFVLLGAIQFVGAGIQRRGIGHAGVQPELVEIIADIVMRLDVARRAGDGIAPHQGIVNHKAQPVYEIAVGKTFQLVQVQQEQADQVFDIVGLPGSGDIFLAQPDIAARHDPAQHIPILDPEVAPPGPAFRPPLLSPRHRAR